MICFRKGDHRNASKHFQRLLEENPENIVAYNNLAVTFEKMGMMREAELLYREAQKISPLASQVLANRGILEYRRGDYTLARDYLERSVHLNRGMAFAYFYLGLSHLRLSMQDEAEESLERSLALSPDHPILLNNLGILYKKAGDFPRALACSFPALDVDRNLTRPYRNVDDILCIIGEWEECRKQIEEAVPDPERRFNLLLLMGQSYLDQEDYDLARKMWELALEIDPDSEEVRKKIAQMTILDKEMGEQ